MNPIDIIKLRHLRRIIEKHQNKPLYQKFFIYTFLSFITLFLIAGLVFVIFVVVVAIQLPNVNDLEKYAASQSSQIFARDGTVLYNIHGEEKRTSIPFNDIPQSLINATIAIEDDQFYQHPGIDIPAIFKAIISEITFQNNRGGSTITQQYIKNTFLNSERKYARKMAEILMALKIERVFNKNQILELYFNRIPYGHNAYGVEEAAKTYFGKHAKDLNLPESVVLASLPKAPSYYSPYGEHKYPKLARLLTEDEILSRNIKEHSDINDDEFVNGLIGTEVYLDSSNKYKIYLNGRTDIILDRMEKLGYINETEKSQATTVLREVEFKKLYEDMHAPHFVLWIKQQLEDKYGKDLVQQGGLKIYTTLDPKLQEIAENAIKDRFDFNVKNYGVSDAALLSVNPQTGEILAMVGSADFNNDDIDGKVNMTLSYIPPGSSFKPFVYGNGFLSHGLTSATVIYDVKTDFGDGRYPKNFDGTFMGPLSIRKALGQSRNIPALKAYFLSGEQKEILPFTQKLGMIYQEPNVEHGSSLALGATGIQFMSFIQAYSVLANQGVKQQIYAISKIENVDGQILEEKKVDQGEQVLDPQVAYLVTDILADSSVKLGSNLILSDRPVATKTGTSTKVDSKNEDIILPKDLLAIGYTPSLLTGVWTGNADGSAGKGLADGYNTSAPIWKKYMTEALRDAPVESFFRPVGITELQISIASGLLPSENTPPAMLKIEKFASFAVPNQTEDPSIFKKVKYDKFSNAIANEFCPPELIEERVVRKYYELFFQYPRWIVGVQNWASIQEDASEGKECPLHNEYTFQHAPTLYITFPQAYSTVQLGEKLPVSVEVNASFGVQKVEFYLDSMLRETLTDKPFTTDLFINRSYKPGEEIELKVKITDKLYYSSEATIKLKIESEGDSFPNLEQEVQPADQVTDAMETLTIQ
ncbi:MAG: penicillin-binding protein, penicillin-binding protein 1A [Candidatus Peregrinibacteria bacterium GW2011_GWF2_33_10]|nr:MAG: penicillin-binding protein, penicillin-binding protein 1A [Candidatus Peregrinibacteria bacterium GW2011_GWF2_33_10]OGJ44352.1 MAG: hypothetical protein A2272_05770 [Candidatus Peregrinibacteria bacterium RIFOXYA12_FULL_33_12]OGJ44480.1 MAG: hypothetical protein A2263_00360 [Candidatus Peregrinibacteria bacterium RIFOXYA2_FULL_33_21]OGJ50230.1 MAG: hypothetical protein A2307_06615 [Candidatus Peregrinibacteria bacterium RIFOXYB2_FULL_33_20]